MAIAMCVEGRPGQFIAVVCAKHAKAPVPEVSRGIGIQQLVRVAGVKGESALVVFPSS